MGFSSYLHIFLEMIAFDSAKIKPLVALQRENCFANIVLVANRRPDLFWELKYVLSWQ